MEKMKKYLESSIGFSKYGQTKISFPEKLFQINLNQVSLALERLRRPSSKHIEKMEQSLKRQGQISPIAVHQSNHEYQLIDGFKRYRAAKSLGWKSLSAVDIQTNEHQAKAMAQKLRQSRNLHA